MILYELAPMQKLPRKEKRSPQTKAIMKRIYKIVSDNWFDVGGYQMKQNKVRLLADYSTMGNIRRQILDKINTNQLGKIGIKPVRDEK